MFYKSIIENRKIEKNLNVRKTAGNKILVSHKDQRRINLMVLAKICLILFSPSSFIYKIEFYKV